MPGSGTDHTREWSAFGGPVIVLVEPQLGENIGTAARAMANFGLTRMRLVRPRPRAGADNVPDAAVLYDSLQDALADCSFVLATTARAHDQAKPVIGPAEAASEVALRIGAEEAGGVG